MTYRHLIHCFGGYSVFLALSGCHGSIGDTGTTGELNKGTFEYECLLDGDATCSLTGAIDSFAASRDLGKAGSIPRAIAVNAIFGLSFDGSLSIGGPTATYHIDPASADDEDFSGQFAIGQPGLVAYLAKQNSGQVRDFTFVQAREASSLQLWSEQDLVGSLVLDRGARREVTVVPSDEDGRLLAGAFPYRWESLNDSVVRIGRLGSGDGGSSVKNEGDIVMSAVSRGITVVRVTSGVLGAELYVEVQ